MVADKVQETGIPQKLGEHANTARDTAAAKYNELTDQVFLLPSCSMPCLALSQSVLPLLHLINSLPKKFLFKDAERCRQRLASLSENKKSCTVHA